MPPYISKIKPSPPTLSINWRIYTNGQRTLNLMPFKSLWFILVVLSKIEKSVESPATSFNLINAEVHFKTNLTQANREYLKGPHRSM